MNDWEVFGRLPWTVGPDDRVEDLWQARRDGVIIDVGWYPDGDEDGSLQGVVVFNAAWCKPIAVFKTTNPLDMTAWAMTMLRTEWHPEGWIGDTR